MIEIAYTIAKLLLITILVVKSFGMLFMCFKAKQIRKNLELTEQIAKNTVRAAMAKSLTMPILAGFMGKATNKKMPFSDGLRQAFEILDSLNGIRNLFRKK